MKTSKLQTSVEGHSLHAVVRAWEDDSERIIYIPKHDGSGEYEAARILNILVVTQPLEGELIIEGIDNNQHTIEMDLEDVRLESPNDPSSPTRGGDR